MILSTWPLTGELSRSSHRMVSGKILCILCLVFAPLDGAAQLPGPKSGVTRVKRIVRQGKKMKESQPSAANSFDQIQQLIRVRSLKLL